MELQLHYKRLDELVESEGNPTSHNVGQLYELILQYGFRIPITVNKEAGGTLRILGGHGRKKALLFIEDKIRRNEIDVPVGLRFEDGSLLVPVVIGDYMPETLARAFIVDDNNSTFSGEFTSVDVLKNYDPLKYLKLLEETIETVVTVDNDDLELMKQLVFEPDTFNPDLEPEDTSPQEKSDSITFTLRFSTQENQQILKDWVDRNSLGTYSGDAVVENL